MIDRFTSADLFHPAVAAVYLSVLMVFTLTTTQPAFIACGLAAAIIYQLLLRGRGQAGRFLAWQLAFLAIIAVANLLFSSAGSTPLFAVGSRTFNLESLVYGLCMGGQLMCMMVICSNATRVLPFDRMLALTGGVAPVLGLVLSMIARLVPHFIRRGRTIASVGAACTAATGFAPDADAGGRFPTFAARRKRIDAAGRTMTTLMAWSMEESLQTADTMKARGWASCPKRSTYRRIRFRTFDAAATAVVAALALGAALCAFGHPFTFYPALSGWIDPIAVVPYALLCAVGPVLEARERLLSR